MRLNILKSYLVSILVLGPALDMQWDKGAGIEPYWIVGDFKDPQNLMLGIGVRLKN